MDKSHCLNCQKKIKQICHQINKTGYCSWDCYLANTTKSIGEKEWRLQTSSKNF